MRLRLLGVLPATGVLVMVVVLAIGVRRPGPQSGASFLPVNPTATPVTATPTLAAAPSPATPTQEPTVTPTNQPTPSPTEPLVPTLEPTSSPTPTSTAAPTETPVATETPTPEDVPTVQQSPKLVTGGSFPRLRIPNIGVNAYIESVGLTSAGAMDVPRRWDDVAWYSRGPRPGQVGNSVIDGHLDSDVAPAVFWYLGSLTYGNHIYVDWDADTEFDFVVHDKRSYPADSAPIGFIFGPAPQANLNLITCAGTWLKGAGAYSNRLVVFTTRVN